MYSKGDICTFTDDEGNIVKGNFHHSYPILRQDRMDTVYVYTIKDKYFISSTCAPFVSCKYNNVFKNSKNIVDIRI